MLVQAIREICPGVGGDEACAVTGFGEVHFLECTDDILAGELAAQLLLQYAEYEQGNVACQEMCLDSVLALEIDWPRLEFGFHDAEAFLNLPPLAVDFYDFADT